MFDLRAIRDNPEAFRTAWERKASGLGSNVDAILAADEKVRVATTAKQEAETVRNSNSKLIGKAKGQGDEAEAQRLMALVTEAKATIESSGADEAAAQTELDALLMGLPNLPLAEVPEGADEEANVQQGNGWGDPKAFTFGPKDHADLGAALKTKLGQPMMDFEAAAAMSGARFVALRGGLAKLERALAAFMLDTQTDQNGYEEVSPPLLVRDNALEGTGQLPKFEEDLFKTDVSASQQDYYQEQMLGAYQSMIKALKNEADDELSHQMTDLINAAPEDRPDWRNDRIAELESALTRPDRSAPKENAINFYRRYLIPTAEVPLTNLVRETILTNDQLPLRMTAHTPCFRSEAGSAGRDTKGMIRLHQFNKVEMVSIVRDEAEGLDELERMTTCAEGILEALNLPYRRMLLCTGDMGFGARKTYDLEVWLPSQNTYREISSCSYCGDFQARRMAARWRPAPSEETPKPKPQFVHTLNGSGLAVGRTLVAVLENYQNEDGSITMPDVLRPYMGGLEVIA